MEGSTELTKSNNYQEQNGSNTADDKANAGVASGEMSANETTNNNDSDANSTNARAPVHLKGEISDIDTDDENDLPVVPERRTSTGTQRLLKEGSAAVIRAAETNQETDSVLSDDGHEGEGEDPSERISFTLAAAPLGGDFRRMSTATFNYISSAGVEQAIPSEPQIDEEETGTGAENFEESFAEISHSWDGVIVDNKLSESAIENMVTVDESVSERGIFTELEHHESSLSDTEEPLATSRTSLNDSSPLDLLSDDISVDSSPSLGGGTPVIPTTSSRSAREILSSAEILSKEDIQSLEELQQEISERKVPDVADEETVLLYHVFSGLTIPSVPLDSVRAILDLEQKQNYSTFRDDDDSIPLPRDCVFQVLERSKVLSIILCRNHQVLLQLPRAFFLALLRILIRLVTNELDHEYNKKILLTCDWTEEDKDVLINQDFSQHLSSSGSGSQFDQTSRLRTYSSASAASESSESKGKKTVGKAMSLGETGSREYDTAKANQIFSIVRLQQSGTTAGMLSKDGDVYAARKILRLFDLIKGQKSYRYLLAPVTRLLGLICSAGVSERVLLRILALASSPVTSSTQVPPVARLFLVRALQNATDGASRSFLMMGKAKLRNFFSFGGGKGLTRTISGLTSWPFRNDFGMAGWFRAETFQGRETKDPVLLSVRAEEGGGIEISLTQLEEESSSDHLSPSAAALVISVFDSDLEGNGRVAVQRLRVPGCILLPRVWYHLAVRHTRSRLKGVFSLSTRQQVSIMLDGKVMATEALNFPKVAEEDFHSENKATAFLQKAVMRSANRIGISLSVAFGRHFNGQSGALYLFHDNVSDATLRAIYEINAGTAGTVKKASESDAGWDSRRGDIVKKSRILDVGIKKDDAEDIVLSQRRSSVGDLASDVTPSNGALAVVDFGDGEDPDLEELPPELSKSSFSSKLFLAWDPSRTVSNMVLELHIGAHVKMAESGVQPWHIEGAQDVISGIGGVQAIIPLFRSLLCGDIERHWLDVPGSYENKSAIDVNLEAKENLWSMIPDLLALAASFVRDHGENARELLRCGGIDVIESSILACRKVVTNKARCKDKSLFGPLTVFPSLSRLLVQSILRLLSACSHYIGLETKVFARLLFNIPLWFSGTCPSLGISLDVTLLPLLSAIVRKNPEKVRDCVGVRDMVLMLKEYVMVDETKVSLLSYYEKKTGPFEVNSQEKLLLHDQTSESSKDVSDRLGMMKANWFDPLTVVERRHMCDIFIGMIFETMACGIVPRDFSPFLDLLSHCLDAEWDESSQEMGEKNQIERTGCRNERYLLSVKSCTILLFLLEMKPPVPNLVMSFAHCCGSVEGGAGWILCSMVNSFDDTIRGLGVRCLSSYMEMTATSPDSPLSVGTAQEGEGAKRPAVEGQSNNNRRIQSGRLALLAVGKGLAAMGPAGVRSIVLPPSKLTARVIYKLLWHLLKGHRSRVGKKTYAALIYLVVDDVGTPSSSLSSLGFLLDKFIVQDDVLFGGYRISMEHTQSLLEETSITIGRSVRDGLGISTVMRLLRYLSSEFKDQLLGDLQKLASSDRASVRILSSLSDWQPCLFHLISETIEKFDAARSNGTKNGSNTLDTNKDGSAAKTIFESTETIERRLDLCIDLYATLLGHGVREGGDKVSNKI